MTTVSRLLCAVGVICGTTKTGAGGVPKLKMTFI